MRIPRSATSREKLSRACHALARAYTLRAPVTEAQPLRKSLLARRDYVPEAPVVFPAQREKNWCKVLARLFRPTVFLIVAALILFGATAAHDWCDAHFAYGVEKTPPYMYRGSIVGALSLPEPLREQLPDGRTIMVTYRGHLPNKSLLQSVSHSRQGDMWYTQDDGNCWVLTTLSATNPSLGWIDP
jgi:hypothetical protein